MIKKRYTGMERRAENIIWNAAGRYDFDPPFMSFLENGMPDLYMNMILGLALRHFDGEKLTAFFGRYAASRRAEEFDALLWLGIENCLYEKEFPDRPVITRLRRERAELFFRYQQTLSRQQMMLQSMLIYTQQEIRWKNVLGEKALCSPAEKRLSEELQYPGTLDTDRLIRRMEETLREHFHFTVPEYADAKARISGARGSHFLKKVLKREDRFRDSLVVRNGTAEGDAERSGQVVRGAGERRGVRKYEEDLAYIRKSLGESILTENQLRILENNLCVGKNAGCRLHVTNGRREENPAKSAEHETGESVRQSAVTLKGRDAKDLERAVKDSMRQAEKNAAWMRGHAYLIASHIRRLSARVDEVLSGYERALPEKARKGQIRAETAWRLPVLQDAAVFLRAGDETERSVTVDLLLDASASRLNYQEALAGQAYIIAKAFMAAGVPVQVETFRSLRGFTVLQILKKRESRDCSHITEYFAGGWNRDGLGLRMAGSFLPEKEEASVRILLVLTDASPNDSTPVPPEKGEILSKEYQGRTAVLDAKEAVTSLAEEDVRVGAVFLGPTLYLENLHTIYGTKCVRIHKIEQLTDGVGNLLEMLLRQEG